MKKLISTITVFGVLLFSEFGFAQDIPVTNPKLGLEGNTVNLQVDLAVGGGGTEVKVLFKGDTSGLTSASNWETGSICFSESFESLSEGFQNALMDLGGVPEEHQTDRLSAFDTPTKSGNNIEFRIYILCHRSNNSITTDKTGDLTMIK